MPFMESRANSTGRAIAAVLVAALVTLIAACSGATTGTPTATPGPLDTPITLAPGEATALGASGWRLRFVAAENDSRCPVGVQCIRAGDVTLRFVASDPAGAASDVAIRYGEGDPTATVGPHTVRVITVAPTPHAGTPIAPTAYRVTLVVR